MIGQCTDRPARPGHFRGIWLAATVLLTAASGGWAQSPAGHDSAPLSLIDLKRAALERNLGLRSSETELKGADLDVRARYAEFFPKLSAEARLSRLGEIQRIQIPAGGFAPSPLLPPVDTEIETGDRTNYQLRFSLEQPLFMGGAIRYRYEDAERGRRLAELGHEQTVRDLLLDVELAYWDILKTDRLRLVAQQQVADLAEHLRVVKASYEAGSVPFNEVLKTTVSLAEAEQRLLTARNNADLAVMAMNHLLRQDLATPLAVAPLAEEAAPEVPAFEEALRGAREHRTELASARTRTESMRLRQHLARSEFLPKLSAVAHYDLAKETAAVLPENWEVLGILRWTFWEWGKTRHEVERAGVLIRRSELDRLAIEDGIALEVREQHLRSLEAKGKIAVARTAVEQAEENYRITRERFAAGVTTNTEVLDAESLLVSARANHTNAVYDFFAAMARLNRAMGRPAGPGEDESP